MTRKKRNYARFYAIAKAKGIDLENHKEDIVLSYTDGRTSSLREMTDREYYEMLDCLQAGGTPEGRERLRRARSNVLVRLQRLGVDTADGSFAAVNKYCMDPRIAGRPFGCLSAEELEELIPKLEAILRKRASDRQVRAQEAQRVATPLYVIARRGLPS